MRFIAKYRHIITALISIFCIGGLIYLGVKTQNLKNENVSVDTFSGKTMGTAVKKTIYSESTTISEQINKEIDVCLSEIDNQLSVRIVDSEVSNCNRNYAVDGIYKLSDNLIGYLKREMEIYEETGGAFSPCIYPVSNLWKIESGEGAVPSEKEIEEALKVTDASDIEVTGDGIIFHTSDMAIDFGAAGKGIAGDRIAEMLAKGRAQGAVISVGGSIVIYGSKGDGKEWHIGIRDPRGEEGDVLGILDFQGNRMISTSGDYEKYFEADGKRYHHIFDPATGYPADKGLISVTIISDSGFLSDALSTACFVMGLEKGMEYVKEKGVDAIFVTSEKEVYLTDGIKKDFRIQADGYRIEK